VRDVRFFPGTCRAAVVAALAAIGAPALSGTAFAAQQPAEEPAGQGNQPPLRLGDYLAGRAAQLEHDWRAAGVAIRRAWEADREDAQLLHEALLLSAAGGDFTGAVGVARAVPADSPDARLANFILTLDDLTEGRYDAAEAKLKPVEPRGLDRFLRPMLMAWSEVGRGRKAQAQEALAGLDQIEGASELRDLQGALLSDAFGDHAQAASLYDKILDGKPSDRAVVSAAWFYQRQGATDKARSAVEKLDPDGISASLRAEMLARLIGKARPPAAPDARAGAADGLYEIAKSMFSDQQRDLVPLLYTRFALHLRPNFPSAQILLAEIETKWGRLDDAVVSLLAIDDKSEFKSTGDRLAIVDLDRAGDTERAFKLGHDAVATFPADIDLRLTYADLLRQKSRFPEAAAQYDAALTKIAVTSNRRGLALYHRGIAYQEMHQWPHAEADLLAALQLRPDDPGLLNYLAFSWADQGINLDRARTMLERAIQLVPDDGAIIDSLGWVMFRAGDFEDAVKQLERAVALDADDATVNDHLGDAYWRVGREIEARAQWERAERLASDKALADQIRTKLRDGLREVTSPRHAEVN